MKKAAFDIAYGATLGVGAGLLVCTLGTSVLKVVLKKFIDFTEKKIEELNEQIEAEPEDE